MAPWDSSPFVTTIWWEDVWRRFFHLMVNWFGARWFGLDLSTLNDALRSAWAFWRTAPWRRAEVADLPKTHAELFDRYSIERLTSTEERKELNVSLLELIKIATTQRITWPTLLLRLLSGSFYSGLLKEAFGTDSIVTELAAAREAWKKGDTKMRGIVPDSNPKPLITNHQITS